MDSYSSYSTSTSTTDVGTLLVVYGILAVIFIVFYVVFSLFMAKIFKKAGEDGWKAWIPVYSQWVFLELGGQPGWIALLSLAGIIPLIGWVGSVVTLVFSAIAAHRIGLNLQKEGWFVVLYILVSPVWIIWLAVDSSTWKGTPAIAANANPGYQPPAPETAPEAPVSQPPVEEEPEQNNTPPTPPIAS